MSKTGNAAPSPPAGKPERLPASLRQSRILAAFEKSGFVSIADLAEAFGVSGMTVRRDLSALDKLGLVERTHGGAVPVGAGQPGLDTVEPAFELRRRQNADQKIAIARTAARMIGPGESVGLDVGTTILALADEIAARRDLRAFTNNLRVAMRLAEGNCTVYTLAGEVRTPEFSIVGSQAVAALSGHFLDHVFIGASGVDANGFYDYSPEDSEVKRAFMASAGSVVVLCDSAKFDRRALARVAALDKVDHLVTDRRPPDALAAALASAGVNLVVAG